MDKKLIYTGVGVLIVIGGIVSIVLKQKPASEIISQPLVSLQGFNQTKNKPVTEMPASPQDFLQFKLTAENPSRAVIKNYVFQINLGSTTDMATVVDAGGSSLDPATNALVWTAVDIAPNQAVEKTFVLRINTFPPQTSKVLTLEFNNQLRVAVTNLAPTKAKQVVSTTPGAVAKVPFTAPATGTDSILLTFIASLSVLTLSAIHKWKTIWPAKA